MIHTVFLDTTVFADRILGRREKRREIDALLAGKNVVSSSYVREQFRATFLRAAVLVYNNLHETRDPLEVLRRTDHYRFFKRGDGVKARKILSALLEDSAMDVDDNLEHMERLIEVDLMGKFDRMAKITDETACCICAKDPIRDEHGIYHFEKSCTLEAPRPCRIESFWTSRRTGLDQLAAAVDDVPPAARAARETLDGHPPRGIRCYVHLSDAVIVAEAAAGSEVMSTNAKDFEPLIRILGSGRRMLRYSSF